MSKETFNIILQSYLAEYSIYNNTACNEYYECKLFTLLSSFGLLPLWNRVVWHSVSQFGETRTLKTLSEDACLSELFVWENTEEGLEFWKHLSNKIYVLN